VPQTERGRPAAGLADLVVRDAEMLVTMDEQRRELPDGWVAITGGLVTGVGDGRTASPPAAEILSAAGSVVTPGFINTHHHTYQNLTRTSSPALGARSFFHWLEALYPVWCRLDRDATRAAAFVGAVELALGGATTTTDMHYIHPVPGLINATIEGVRGAGLRFHPTRGTMDMTRSTGGLPPDEAGEDRDTALADAERLIGRYHEPGTGGMARIALGPCSPFSASREMYLAMADMSRRYSVGLHSHWAESHEELRFTEERFGMHTMDYLRDLGLDGPRTWLAHVLLPRDEDIPWLAEQGVGVSHCPGPIMMMGGRSGAITPIREMRDAGVKVGLGCDGSASNDAASLWLDAHRMIGLQRIRHHRRMAGMSGREAIEIATLGGAELLGRPGEIGSLAVGAAGDLVAWPVDGVAYSGVVADTVEALFQTGPNAARHTVVAGRIVVMDGAFTGPGLADALAEHRRRARALQAGVPA
jgi:cytosine/adenosine deaminase-related metal-dependent hydrolase